ILDLELEPDGPVKDYCGTCTRCIDACPTQAIIKPQVVDGSKCISYFTIELREAIPQQYTGQFENWAFGCDICQEVCPWNRFSVPHTDPDLSANEALLEMTAQDWIEITDEIFQKKFSDSPLMRTGYEGMKRNVEFILKRV
ncbi:MAG TPA: 4Fe-4S double cluster binding domain-containing protein, partial [Bacteroidia bacterium]|nr:4Fe-4S double cluster binding domain-containing protein [Bacteroidia bacterium]